MPSYEEDKKLGLTMERQIRLCAGLVQGDAHYKPHPWFGLVDPYGFIAAEEIVPSHGQAKAGHVGFNEGGNAGLNGHAVILVAGPVEGGEGVDGCSAGAGEYADVIGEIGDPVMAPSEGIGSALDGIVVEPPAGIHGDIEICHQLRGLAVDGGAIFEQDRGDIDIQALSFEFDG